MKIAVDAMGGDFAPQSIVEGAILAAREHRVPVVLVGEEKTIRREVAKIPGERFPAADLRPRLRSGGHG